MKLLLLTFIFTVASVFGHDCIDYTTEAECTASPEQCVWEYDFCSGDGTDTIPMPS